MESDLAKRDALILVSKLFKENKISEDDRDVLKDMIFNDDSVILAFFSHYEDKDEIQT